MLRKKGFFFIVIFSFVLMLQVPVFSGNEVDQKYQHILQTGPRYEWEATTLTFQNRGMTLVGTLTLPKTQRSSPIVLILHGFAGDRKGALVTGTTEGYHEIVARVLAEQGICSFRFDFRGSGESDGDFSLTCFNGQLCDSIAALDFIDSMDDPVDTSMIGLLGHSQGGLVASLVASQDKRIRSLVLWAAVAFPPLDFEGLLLKDGLKTGLALPDGGTAEFGIYVDGTHILDLTLGKQFFVDLFTVQPLAAIRDYKRPMLYISPLKDVVVWPQPAVGKAYLKHHRGYERLITVDSGHNFDYAVGPDKAIETAYWSTAWFLETLDRN